MGSRTRYSKVERKAILPNNQRNRERIRNNFAAGLFGCSFGLILLIVTVGIFRYIQVLDRHGVETEAIVMEKFQKLGKRSGPINTLIYQYQVGAQTYQGEDNVSDLIYDETEIGDLVQIEYLDNNQKRSQLAGHWPIMEFMVAALMMIFALVSGIGLLVRSIWLNWRIFRPKSEKTGLYWLRLPRPPFGKEG